MSVQKLTVSQLSLLHKTKEEINENEWTSARNGYPCTGSQNCYPGTMYPVNTRVAGNTCCVDLQ